MNRFVPTLLTIAVLGMAALILSRLAARAQEPQHFVGNPGEVDPNRWDPINEEFGQIGVLKGKAYVLSFPRKDVSVMIEAGVVPEEAGVESTFYFWPCPCGKMNVTGQFVVLDYEANDVMDALREARLKVASIGPMFVGDQPRLLLIRFQGGGTTAQLVKQLHRALRWTGEERNQPDESGADDPNAKPLTTQPTP